eukprot:9465005-Alexandrium_andersonii.AAC.1
MLESVSGECSGAMSCECCECPLPVSCESLPMPCKSPSSACGRSSSGAPGAWSGGASPSGDDSFPDMVASGFSRYGCWHVSRQRAGKQAMLHTK